jgi:hypothetical protein
LRPIARRKRRRSVDPITFLGQLLDENCLTFGTVRDAVGAGEVLQGAPLRGPPIQRGYFKLFCARWSR